MSDSWDIIGTKTHGPVKTHGPDLRYLQAVEPKLGEHWVSKSTMRPVQVLDVYKGAQQPTMVYVWYQREEETSLRSCPLDVFLSEHIRITHEEKESSMSRTRYDRQHIWYRRNNPVLPDKVKVVGEFIDDGTRHLVFTELSEAVYKTLPEIMFLDAYSAQPVYEAGALYWSGNTRRFYLYQGEGKASLCLRTDTGMAETRSDLLPADVQRVAYSEGSSFTLNYRHQ